MKKSIQFPHALSPEEARQKAEELARSLEKSFGLSWRWTGNVLSFEAPSGIAKGVKGTVTLPPKSVHVDVELPVTLKAMQGILEKKVTEGLAKAFGKGSA